VVFKVLNCEISFQDLVKVFNLTKIKYWKSMEVLIGKISWSYWAESCLILLISYNCKHWNCYWFKIYRTCQSNWHTYAVIAITQSTGQTLLVWQVVDLGLGSLGQDWKWGYSDDDAIILSQPWLDLWIKPRRGKLSFGINFCYYLESFEKLLEEISTYSFSRYWSLFKTFSYLHITVAVGDFFESKVLTQYSCKWRPLWKQSAYTLQLLWGPLKAD